MAKAPGVLPKNLYSNNLLSHIATEHYVNGIRLGHLERQTGVNIGSLIKAMQRSALAPIRTLAPKHGKRS